MMKLKNLIVVSALGVAMSLPAFANEGQVEVLPMAQDTAADVGLIFETDATPMQLAALSPQEMRETEGAFVPFVYGGLAAANYAWTAFRVSGIAVGAYRAIGPAYRGGRVFQVMRNNNPIFRVDNHRNPYTSNVHFHSAPNMSLHRPWYAPWRGR